MAVIYFSLNVPVKHCYCSFVPYASVIYVATFGWKFYTETEIQYSISTVKQFQYFTVFLIRSVDNYNSDE